MKATTLIVLGGLLISGASLAAEPQSQTTGPAMKIGIDPVTGQRRVLTSEESAALDEQQAPSGNNLRAKAAAKATAPVSPMLARFPATNAEAMAGAVQANGIVAMKPSLEALSSIAVERNADGTLSYSENGEPMTEKREAASE